MIGIICAIPQEVEAVCAYMDKKEKLDLYGIEIFKGNIKTKEVIVAYCGVGKVNAAMSTSLLISKFDVSVILNIGVAGGLLESQNILDVVLSRNVIQHDFDTSPIDGKEGIGLSFACDEKLRSLCEKVLKEEKVSYYVGDIASGDIFVTKDNHYNRIREMFPTCLCAEMEAGAILQVCKRLNKPCMIIRSLSDVAPKGNGHIDFPTFAKQASLTAGKIMSLILEEI